MSIARCVVLSRIYFNAKSIGCPPSTNCLFIRCHILIVSNLLTSVMMGPVVVVLSALSLTVLSRSMEWVSSVAKNPSPPKGLLRDLKPYMKNVYSVMERVMGGEETCL